MAAKNAAVVAQTRRCARLEIAGGNVACGKAKAPATLRAKKCCGSRKALRVRRGIPTGEIWRDFAYGFGRKQAFRFAVTRHISPVGIRQRRETVKKHSAPSRIYQRERSERKQSNEQNADAPAYPGAGFRGAGIADSSLCGDGTVPAFPETADFFRASDRKKRGGRLSIRGIPFTGKRDG